MTGRNCSIIIWLFVAALAHGGFILNGQSNTSPTAAQQPGSTAQQPGSAAQQPGSVDGRVTNSLTGDLVPGATIRLRTLRYGGRAAADPQTRSQPDGSFRFETVFPGSYILTAEVEGFVSNEANVQSRFLTVQPGQSLTGVSLQLTPAGSISGKVEDDEGHPIVGARVSALTPNATRGKASLKQGSDATADAAGGFQLSRLPPGDYYVLAESAGGKKEPAPAESGGGELVRTIYPRALAFEDASTIQIAAGQSISDITVRLRRVTTHHIRGKIGEAPSGGRVQRPRITISPVGAVDSPALARSSEPAADGSFDIAEVVTGSYTLRLQGDLSPTTGNRGMRRQSLLGRQDIQVGASDLEGVVLSIIPPVDITGRVTIESSATGAPNLSRMSVLARPLEDQPHATQARGVIASDGSFSLNSLDPGLYVIDVYLPPAGMYVKSISLNQQDILHAEVDLSQGGAGSLEIVLRSGTGEVDGTIQSPDGPAPTSIILVPERVGPYGSGVLFSYSRADGGFALPNIPPGKYFAYAATQADPNIWQNRDFLHLLENSATSISVDENSRVQVQLQKLSFDQVAQAAGRLGLTLP